MHFRIFVILSRSVDPFQFDIQIISKAIIISLGHEKNVNDVKGKGSFQFLLNRKIDEEKRNKKQLPKEQHFVCFHFRMNYIVFDGDHRSIELFCFYSTETAIASHVSMTRRRPNAQHEDNDDISKQWEDTCRRLTRKKKYQQRRIYCANRWKTKQKMYFIASSIYHESMKWKYNPFRVVL